LFTEAALHVGNQLIFLQVPDKSAIDHAFDHFTQTACKCYWAVTGWITYYVYDEQVKVQNSSVSRTLIGQAE